MNSNLRVLLVEMRLVLTVLQLQGWNIKRDKSTVKPTHMLVYQGFEIDTVKMEYRLPELKVQILVELIEAVLDKAQTGMLIPSKELSCVFRKQRPLGDHMGQLYKQHCDIQSTV